MLMISIGVDVEASGDLDHLTSWNSLRRTIDGIEYAGQRTEPIAGRAGYDNFLRDGNKSENDVIYWVSHFA